MDQTILNLQKKLNNSVDFRKKYMKLLNSQVADFDNDDISFIAYEYGRFEANEMALKYFCEFNSFSERVKFLHQRFNQYTAIYTRNKNDYFSFGLATEFCQLLILFERGVI